MRPRRSKSVIALAVAMFSLVAVMPIIAVFALETVLSSYYKGEITLFTKAFNPEPPIAKLGRQSDAIARRLNIALAENPERLLSQEFLRRLAAGTRGLAIAVRVDGKSLLASGPLPENCIDMLPSYGEVIDPVTPPPDPDRLPFFILDQIDFRTGTGLKASAFVIRSVPGRNEPHPVAYSRILLLIVVTFLVILNGIIGFILLRRFIRPLGTLERAAHRIGEGKFDQPVSLPGIEELDTVFTAFETMRMRLDELIAKVKREERSRRDMIANLSHDVRTPLTTVKGYVDGLSSGVADTEEKRKKYLAVIGEQAGRLERMLEDIFLLATIQAGESGMKNRNLDLSDFVSSGVQELSIAYPSCVISFEPRDNGIPVKVSGDPVRLRRMVENIVGNSERHSHKTDTGILVTLRTENGMAVLAFADDGTGFDETTLNRAFERFYRGDESRTDEGSGLGLAIAKEIVAAHGGTIDAGNGDPDSAYPGAVITVTLPLARENADGEP